MNTPSLRNSLYCVAFFFVAFTVGLADLLLELAFFDSSYFSGWALTSLIGLLALFNIRKRLPFLPLGDARTWYLIHIVAGLLAVFIFLMHTNWTTPKGLTERLLALFFCLVALSGFLGIWLQKYLPLQLSRRGEIVIFERVPRLVRKLREDIEDEVQNSLETTGSSTIVDFYQANLLRFVSRPYPSWERLFSASKRNHRRRTSFENLDRYLNDQERDIMHRIAELVSAKEEVDYQYTCHLVLKGWLFIHIPGTAALIVFAFVHIAVVHAYIAFS